jgi:hypothetical protein
MYQRRAEQVALEVNAESLGRPDARSRPSPFGEKAEIDRLRERIRAGGWVHDIKVWNPEFRVLHTPEPEHLGRIRRPSAPLHQAMTQGIATTNFARVHAAGGGDTARLFEVYAPLVREGGTVTGVVEVYLPYAPVARAIREDTRAAVAVVGGGLAPALRAAAPHRRPRLTRPAPPGGGEPPPGAPGRAHGACRTGAGCSTASSGSSPRSTTAVRRPRCC